MNFNPRIKTLPVWKYIDTHGRKHVFKPRPLRIIWSFVSIASLIAIFVFVVRFLKNKK